MRRNRLDQIFAETTARRSNGARGRVVLRLQSCGRHKTCCEQLSRWGIRVPAHQVDSLDALLNATARLYVTGLISAAVASSALRRLLRHGLESAKQSGEVVA